MQYKLLHLKRRFFENNTKNLTIIQYMYIIGIKLGNTNMPKEIFKLEIPKEKRKISVTLTSPPGDLSKLQWVIMLHGLYSKMDGQEEVARTYNNAGLGTLQPIFKGHGEGENKSDGELQNVTLSSGISDLKTTYDYATQKLSIPERNLVIGANSYGALVALLAMNQRLISPESMILVAPFSLNRFRPWIPLLRFIKKIPGGLDFLSKKVKISPALISDYLQNHTHPFRKDLFGSTAVHFFVGANDRHISDPNWICRFCETNNKNSPTNVPFVDGTQAHCTIYPGLGHGRMPKKESEISMKESIAFIKATHALRNQ